MLQPLLPGARGFVAEPLLALGQALALATSCPHPKMQVLLSPEGVGRKELASQSSLQTVTIKHLQFIGIHTYIYIHAYIKSYI